jgi:hypothetical protein
LDIQTKRNERKLRLRGAITWLLLAGVAACGNSELNRGQAARALAARINGPAGSTRVFRERCVEKNFDRYPIRFIEDTQTARQYRLLEEAGLATTLLGQPTAEKCGTPYLESKQLIAITLTPKGAAENWPEHQERGGGWDVGLARRELVEVTDILPEPDPTLSRAEFTWRFVPTAGGAALGQTSEPRRGSATFRRYADGWRMMGMRY